MTVTKISDKEFVAEWNRLGSADLFAKTHNINRRTIQRRRLRMMQKGYELFSEPLDGNMENVPIDYRNVGWTFPANREFDLFSGSVIVSSDHHYWPDMVPVAHRALLKVIKIVKPRVKILNGDVFDGGSISRHLPMGWNQTPSPIDELHACQERVGEIEQALPKGCERWWALGNHDTRFERNIATKAPELAGLNGVRLTDHFPGWDICHSFWLNRTSLDPVMVFHNYANGIHAGYNNAMKSGVTTVTGHTHSLECKPYSDLRGRRYGIQTGTIADLDGPQFEYQGNRPSQACSGFVVLTFRDNRLLQPEICQVIDGKAWFRGEIVAQREKPHEVY